MAAALLPAAKIAVGALPVLGSIFGRRSIKGPNYREIIDRYRAEKPTGYLTPEDTAFADTNFKSGAAKVGKQIGSARTAAAGRLAARGLSLSPAAEAVSEGLNEQESNALTGLERDRQATLYGIRTGREKYQQGMNLQGMLAELSGARYNFEQAASQRSGFMNSLLDLAPEVFDYFGGLGKGSVPKTNISGQGLPGGVPDVPLPDPFAP